MAGRRCFSDKIVESDAFYALSASAQALYYHLNQAADDDGFINNASSIASRIKGGKTALSDLVKARFLLQFWKFVCGETLENFQQFEERPTETTAISKHFKQNLVKA